MASSNSAPDAIGPSTCVKCGEVDPVKAELLDACLALLNVYDRSQGRSSYIEAVLQINAAVAKAIGGKDV